MRPVILATLMLFTASEIGGIQDLMQQAFYPALLGILVIASLGIPIPEDIPLIAAGVLLNTHPGVATWPGTIAVALLGIMTGDLVLYTVGRWWGPGLVNHRSVRWMISPEKYQRGVDKFHEYGAWFCFFGRFFVGIRAIMCMTAGATHFPYWRFFLADFAGALLSIPFFVGLGYVFADAIPKLRAYVGGVQMIMLGAAAIVLVVGVILYRRRKRRRREAARADTATEAATATVTTTTKTAPLVIEAATKSKVGAGT